MTSEELLKAGIVAAQAGRLAEASNLLLQVVKLDPGSELGWFWLGMSRTASEQREYCFRRVLEINPQNIEARRQLDLAHTPAVNIQEAKPSTASNAPERTPANTSATSPEKKSPVVPKTSTKQPVAKTARPQPRKKSNHVLLWSSLALVALICLAAAGIFVASRFLTTTSSPANTPLVPVTPSPTSIPITPTPNYKPLFESAPCFFTAPDQANVDCGFVIVPEDRNNNPTDTIRIAVAHYHSTSSAPRPDPVLYLSGGPGGEAIGWSVGAYSSVIAPLLGERDFIVFDPRGVGHSEPVLNCDEFSQTYLQDLQGHIPADQRVSYYEGALLGCKNNLVKMGANLSAYTSVDMAADAKDVLIALGYQQANLYGISYGTRVSQFVMKNHSEVVRSAILDSVVPVEVQMFNQSDTRYDEVLHILFNDCNADPACSHAYPDLEAAYNQSFAQLNTEPIQVTVTISENRKLQQSVDGYTFRNAILWMMRSPQTISLVPQLIDRVHDGDRSTLLLSLALPVVAFDSISMGSYISVNCHDQAFAMSLEDLDATIYNMCKLWDIKPPMPGENDPVTSEIPTLIFAGRYDTTTPTTFAHQLAGHLTHSYIAEIANQGHAPSSTGFSDCPTRIIQSFLQDPNTAPDLICVAEIQTAKFIVPFDANAPIVLEPASIQQYQINTRAPSGWSKAEFGFYNRNGFLGDMTQVGIQKAAVSASDWLTWLVTNFKGKEGLDQPATPFGEHTANGMTWTLYKTSSQGHPVAIAMAKSGKETLMVLLISHKDEYDALFNNVFLPIIDSTTSSP